MSMLASIFQRRWTPLAQLFKDHFIRYQFCRWPALPVFSWYMHIHSILRVRLVLCWDDSEIFRSYYDISTLGCCIKALIMAVCHVSKLWYMAALMHESFDTRPYMARIGIYFIFWMQREKNGPEIQTDRSGNVMISQEKLDFETVKIWI